MHTGCPAPVLLPLSTLFCNLLIGGNRGMQQRSEFRYSAAGSIGLGFTRFGLWRAASWGAVLVPSSSGQEEGAAAGRGGQVGTLAQVEGQVCGWVGSAEGKGSPGRGRGICWQWL